ncbi:aminopeptidase [Fulvivirga lutea]|uniref:Aminopeptidase n=1 Tax=Fulvivirga lutea TaxID=2810512 RepID=A0A974WIE1_9BACT|nr:aminopeptidase [Fulvivirga lutea]QSE99016.1 aminopeptidase [Fulvivirga lutea]
MKRGYKILLVFILLLVAVFFVYSDLIVYGLRQGKGQWHIVSNAKPVEEFLSDPNVDQSTKEKLNLVQDVREFCVSQLGLSDTENYTEMYDQQGKPVLWVVTACKPFSFEPYQWKFPVVGTVPYKGFFEEALAHEEAKRLSELGLDTNIRTVGGWSTLGWFKDPILSEMLKRNDGELANLIVHELVHATIFVKDSVEFNENLASYIGDKGAEEYLKKVDGQKGLEEYIRSKEDQQKFVNHILRGYQQLDTLYIRNSDKSVELQRLLKTNMIDSIMNALDTLTLNDPNYLSKLKGYQPNNAYFMSFKRYRAKQPILDSIFTIQFDSNLINFIEYFKQQYAAE